MSPRSTAILLLLRRCQLHIWHCGITPSETIDNVYHMD